MSYCFCHADNRLCILTLFTGGQCFCVGFDRICHNRDGIIKSSGTRKQKDFSKGKRNFKITAIIITLVFYFSAVGFFVFKKRIIAICFCVGILLAAILQYPAYIQKHIKKDNNTNNIGGNRNG